MAANGVDVPTKITLSGTGVTNIAGNQYAKTLTGTDSVVVTAAVKDAQGDTLSIGGNVQWYSDNADVASVVAGTVLAHAPGQANIEAAYQFGDLDGENDIETGKVYATLTVQVNP